MVTKHINDLNHFRAANSPYILAQSAIPVCLAPNGTVATNGIVTLGTALPATYSGGIWLRLPADAIVGGAAGLYWAVMSSTTAGQVYTNFADPASQFIPSIPTGTLVAAVGSNAAYTQATAADVTLVNVTIPAGAMGPNGRVTAKMAGAHNNSAGAKLYRQYFGGQLVHSFSVSTTVSYRWDTFVANTGTETANTSPASNATATAGAMGATLARFSVDTTANVSYSIVGQLATATDFQIIPAFSITVERS